MVDAAHEKETRARETIQALKSEITNLTKLVEQGAGLSMGQDNRFNDFLLMPYNVCAPGEFIRVLLRVFYQGLI